MKALPFLVFLVFSFGQLPAQAYDTVWVRSIDTRADSFFKAGNLPQCVSIFQAAADTARLRFGPESVETARLLETLGDFQKVAYDFAGAEKTITELLDLLNKIYGGENAYVAKAMGQLGYTRFNLGKFETVIPLLTGARQLFERLGLHYSHELATVTTSLAAVYQAQGFYLKAEKLHLETLEIEENMPVIEEHNYATTINNIAVFYSIVQRPDEAIRYYDIALKLKEKLFGKHHPFYLISMRSKGRTLIDAGRYREAENILKEAMEIAQKTFGPEDPQYSPYLLGLATLYEKTGSYEAAIPLAVESQRLVKQRYGGVHPEYVSGLINLANLQRSCNHLGVADTLLHEAIRILEQEKRTQTNTYTGALVQLGRVYQLSGQYDLARPLLEKGARLGGEILGMGNPAYYEKYGEALIRQNLLDNRPDSALQLLDALRDPILSTYGEDHERYINLETQYGTACQLKGDAPHALEHFRTAFGALQRNLAGNFGYLTIAEREKFARSFENCRVAFLATARAFPTNPDVCAFLFDLMLFQKELLASYDRQQLAGWQQNPDSSYRAYVEVRRMIARQWTLPVKDRLDLPELEVQRASLEKSLAAQSVPGAIQAFHPVRWQQVQHALQTGDAALEWLSLPPARAGSGAPCYAALLLRPGLAAPELILLPAAGRIDSLFASKGNRGLQYATRTYAGDALYRTFWKPLEARLAGVKRLIYAPTGALHLLNFDAIRLPGGQLLSEKYRLVRVANTARLLDAGLGKTLAGAGQALLAGGLDYESSGAESAPGAVAEVSRWRGGGGLVREWAALPNTLPEVQRLAAMLREKRVQTTLLTGPNGSETAVKERCNAGAPEILHFATHGFFFEKNTAAPGSLGLVAAENPMFRSGLILAGANSAWRGDANASATGDDGILTADEISLLPLRNTALVVLSACETGLGDVHDDEGVYGLQRAFRLAGAQNIVMSLWRVPDEQTRLFMEAFYQALMENGDAHEAMQRARQAMRKAFGSPYYWAGFVLLE